jgi:hypothetical protein
MCHLIAPAMPFRSPAKCCAFCVMRLLLLRKELGLPLTVAAKQHLAIAVPLEVEVNK